MEAIPKKRPRGRPRKTPIEAARDDAGETATSILLTETPATIDSYSGAPVLLSIGIEKKNGLYSTFLLKTRGNRVIEKIPRQEDIKQSSLDRFYIEMLEHFVDPNF